MLPPTDDVLKWQDSQSNLDSYDKNGNLQTAPVSRASRIKQEPMEVVEHNVSKKTNFKTEKH
jgi:hypothetical protein